MYVYMSFDFAIKSTYTITFYGMLSVFKHHIINLFVFIKHPTYYQKVSEYVSHIELERVKGSQAFFQRLTYVNILFPREKQLPLIDIVGFLCNSNKWILQIKQDQEVYNVDPRCPKFSGFCNAPTCSSDGDCHGEICCYNGCVHTCVVDKSPPIGLHYEFSFYIWDFSACHREKKLFLSTFVCE